MKLAAKSGGNLVEHSILQGVRNLVSSKRDVFVLQELPADAATALQRLKRVLFTKLLQAREEKQRIALVS